MKILIYGINFSPELTGIGKYTGELANGISRLGHDVRVITTPPHYPQWAVQKPYSGARYMVERSAALTVFRCPIWVPRKPTGLLRIISSLSFGLTSLPVLLRMCSWRPDLILIIAPSLVAVPFALPLAKIMRWKTWLHLQDFEVDAAFQLGIVRGPVFKAFSLRVEAALFRRFERVSTISARMVEILIKKGVAANRVSLLRNWVDTKAIYPIHRSSYRDTIGIEDDVMVCLFSGSLSRKQGLHVLIECARRLRQYPSIVFIIAGEGDMKQELVESSKGLSNVRYLGLQPLAALNEFLGLADVHLLPQSKEAADLVLPSKLTGMLSSGRPVLASAAADSELGGIVSACGLLVAPESPDGFVEALLRLHQSAELRERLGEKGRAYAVANLSFEEILNQFSEQLSSVVAK